MPRKSSWRTINKKVSQEGTFDSKLESNFHSLWIEHSSFPMTIHHTVKISHNWELDFAFPAEKIGIEIQGYGTGHLSYLGMNRDYKKHNDFVLNDWIVLYFMSIDISPEHIRNTIATIKTILRKKNARATDINFPPQERRGNEPDTLSLAKRRLLDQRTNRR